MSGSDPQFPSAGGLVIGQVRFLLTYPPEGGCKVRAQVMGVPQVEATLSAWVQGIVDELQGQSLPVRGH